MTKQRFRGTGTALVTPFAPGGSVDETSLARLVDFQIDGGIDMIVPCGTTGEGATMEGDEYERVIGSIVERVAGRVPVIAGAGCNSTERAVKLTRTARRLGADGVLSVGPYYNKPTQAGFYEHFKAIAEADDIPVVVYNVPSRTSSNISAETMLRLADLPGIVAVKESSGDFDQVMEIIRNRPDGFSVLSGDDWATLPMVALGGDGVVSVAANEAPTMIHDMVDAALAGDLDRARALHYRLLPLMRANFIETNPIPVKAALAMMGMIDERYRLPLVPMAPENKARLRSVVEDLGLFEGSEVGRRHGE
jgi:4-hydroxy-tetrahydrodipicolinate synthase